MAWATILPGLAGAFAVAALIWLANRGASHQWRGVVRLGFAALFVLGAGGLGFTAAVSTWAIGVLPTEEGNAPAWAMSLLGALGVLSLVSFADGLRRRATWDDDGVRLRKGWGPERAVDWSEVAALDYRPAAQYWRLGLADGTGFAFSEMMTGAHAFIRACARRPHISSNSDLSDLSGDDEA